MATTTRTRSSTATPKRTPARRRTTSTAKPKAAAAIGDDARKAVRSARTRASRAVKSIPTDSRTLTIAGILAGAVAAGVALFLGRDRVRSAASTGGEKIKQVADDLSVIAHEKIDQARDNITRLRNRHTPVLPAAAAELAETFKAVG